MNSVKSSVFSDNLVVQTYMHQTFYIDIDEEITSIVDRLRKAKTREIVIVVPKRALLIQSLVNLKLLKKESDGLKKDLIIVTQDKLGKTLLENIGIPVEQKMDDIAGEETIVQSEQIYVAEQDELEAESLVDLKSAESKTRLENLGSAEYFAKDPGSLKTGLPGEITAEKRKTEDVFAAGENFSTEASEPQVAEERIINKELVTDIGRGSKKVNDMNRVSSMDIVKNIDIRQAGLSDFAEDSFSGDKTKKHIPERKNPSLAREDLGEERNGGEKIGEFFQHGRLNEGKKDIYNEVNLAGGFWKFFLLFGGVAAGLFLLIAGYLFLPKTDIKIFVKTKVQSVDAEIKGLANSTAVDAEAKTIPSRIVSTSDELSGNFSASGGKSVSNQKAKGIITIYNEYSASPQPLVATTRFLSEGGKIFRLIKGVSVPGTTVVSGETKPGAIEAEVIADSAGEEYNIEPTTFKIPGFEGSGTEKYNKFYAKSFKKMSGGGSASQTVKTITNSDIANAKNKLAGELADSLRQKIKKEAGSDMIIPDDAINASDAVYILSAAEGEVADNFTVTVKINGSAVAVKNQDLRDVLKALIAGTVAGESRIDEEKIQLEFGKSDANFSSGDILIRVSARGSIVPDIDLENLEKGILGKNEADFEAYLRTYPEIEGAEINYWPTFIKGKIPAYASRVNIEFDPS